MFFGVVWEEFFKIRKPTHSQTLNNKAESKYKNGEHIPMLDFMKDLWGFMQVRKKFWLAPIILVMLMLGALIVLSQGSAVAPFIYTLF